MFGFKKVTPSIAAMGFETLAKHRNFYREEINRLDAIIAEATAEREEHYALFEAHSHALQLLRDKKNAAQDAKIEAAGEEFAALVEMAANKLSNGTVIETDKFIVSDGQEYHSADGQQNSPLVPVPVMTENDVIKTVQKAQKRNAKV